MGRIIFIVGGARSGKSTLAVNFAQKYKKVAFVATCQPLDEEMTRRIQLHKESRPLNWSTFEEPKDLSIVLKKIKNNFECILIDCVTLLVSNLMLDKVSEKDILQSINIFLNSAKNINSEIIVVSNEVGLGIVPDNVLGREFRDIAGRVNQLFASAADEVYFTVSGIPLKIKGEQGGIVK